MHLTTHDAMARLYRLFDQRLINGIISIFFEPHPFLAVESVESILWFYGIQRKGDEGRDKRHKGLKGFKGHRLEMQKAQSVFAPISRTWPRLRSIFPSL
jgi:hypothetical protein